MTAYAGAVSGTGNFTGLDGVHRFERTYGPGHSAGAVQIGNVQWAGVVTMELGGLESGTRHLAPGTRHLATRQPA